MSNPYTSPDETFLFAEVQVGVEIEDFLRSTVGRYLQERARKSVDDFIKIALELTPDPKRLEAAKLRAYAAREMMRFLAEAVHNGGNAQQALSEMDENSPASAGAHPGD